MGIHSHNVGCCSATLCLRLKDLCGAVAWAILGNCSCMAANERASVVGEERSAWWEWKQKMIDVLNMIRSNCPFLSNEVLIHSWKILSRLERILPSLRPAGLAVL